MTTDYNTLYHLAIEMYPRLAQVPARAATTCARVLELIASSERPSGANWYNFGKNNVSNEDFKSRVDIELAVARIATLYGFEPSILLGHLILAMFTIANYYQYGDRGPHHSYLAIPRIPKLLLRVDAYCAVADILGFDLAGIAAEYIWQLSGSYALNNILTTTKADIADGIKSLTPFRRWLITRYQDHHVALPYVDDLMKELRDTHPDIAISSAEEIELFINSSTTMNRIEQDTVKYSWPDNSAIGHIRNIRTLFARFGLGD
jgi:hypothetical protein